MFEFDWFYFVLFLIRKVQSVGKTYFPCDVVTSAVAGGPNSDKLIVTTGMYIGTWF